MYRKLTATLIAALVAILALPILTAPALAGPPAQQTSSESPQVALGSALTYQGRLTESGSPANGQYDIRFTLFDALLGGSQVGSPLSLSNQTVTNGLFTVSLDFGSPPFTGDARYLQLEVKPAGGPSYTLLSPRQPLTPSPYALSLRPGASVNGALATPLLSLTNTGTNGTGISGVANGGTIAKGVSGESANGYGGFFTSSTGVGVSASGADGVSGTGTASNGSGVRGTANNGTGARGVLGISLAGSGVYGTSTSGAGVYGTGSSGYGGDFHSATGTGVNVAGANGTYSLGTSSNGVGLWGVANTGPSAKGVYGTSATGYGIYGSTTALGGRAIFGIADSGQSAAGVFGTSLNGSGVQGTTNTGQGIYGVAATTGYGGYFSSNSGTGIYSTGGNGIYSVSTANDGKGIWGVANNGSYPVGVYGETSNWTTGWAGFFFGNVGVSGSCCASSELYTRIDHPLDPANQYLNQSLVQSSEMLSVLNGNVALDAQGEVLVTLPSYFQATNADFRYTLTPVGAPGPNLYIAEELASNTFKIAGGKPGGKVSWQVTGVRIDPYAEAHPLVAETDKPAEHQGFYLHPELYGLPESKQLDRPGPRP